GLLALLLGGLYRPSLFYEAFLLPTSAGVFANLLLVAILLRHRPGLSHRNLLGAGLLLGLGTLIQGNLILFLPFLIGWVLFIEKGKGRARGAAALLAGFLLAISPVTIRNVVRGNDFVLVSSHGGINFYMGNNKAASGVFTFPDEPIVLSPENINIHDSRRIAEEAAGRGLKPSEVSWYWARRSLSWIRENPGAYLALLGRKAVLHWNKVELPDNADQEFFTEQIRALRRIPFVFGVVGPLGAFGLALLLRRRRGSVLVLFLAAQFLSALLFYTHSRYRIPFSVALAVPAAIGAVALAQGIRSWPWAGRLWAAGALALLFVLVNAGEFGAGRGVARASSLTHLANGLLESGDREGAESAYREALRLLPGYPTAHYGLGRLCQLAGRLEEAEGEYRAAVRGFPTFGEAYANLGTVYHAMGENEKAVAELLEAIRLRPAAAEPRYNLGNALFDMGRHDEAVRHYRAAGELDPKSERVVRNLSNALEKEGDLAAAEGAVRRGLERIGRSADLSNRLGDLLEKQGRPEEAMREYLRAVEIDPRHSVAWNNIGLLRFHQGEIEAAIEAWRTILAYDPQSPVVANIRMAEEARGAGREGGSR
ncbi:MAG: tetratricopeptide repeat protein, partial [Candidatus Eisenbacteria bacterium]